MFREAIKYGRLAGNDTLIGATLNNMAVVQSGMNDYEGALLTLEESIQINRKLGRDEQIRFNQNNLAVALVNLGRNEQAIDTLNNLLIRNYKLADTTEIANNLMNLGVAYYNLGKPDTAYHYLENALVMVKDDLLRRKIYFTFDKVLVSKNDYKSALEFSHKFILLSDSLFDVQTNEYLLDLDSKYKTLIKERDLEEAQTNLANQRTLIYVIVGALLIFVILAIFLTVPIRIKKRSEQSLREINERFAKQAEELTASNAQITEINENLEAMVKHRTATLQKQNERLLHFTFLNSHRIRGPIATLLGLVHLLKDENNAEIESEVKVRLYDTAHNLDTMVRNVTIKLEEEDIEENGLGFN